MLYNDEYMEDTLTFDDIFTSAEDFETKMDAVASPIGDTIAFTPYDELYHILALKYVGSHTRYQSPEPFIWALVRELRIIYPIYKQQKALIDDIRDMDIDDIRKRMKNLRNLVENPNEAGTQRDEVAITDTSTQQESFLQLGNELEAAQDKYAAIARNYQNSIYRAVDPLFRQILAEDQIPVYEQ